MEGQLGGKEFLDAGLPVYKKVASGLVRGRAATTPGGHDISERTVCPWGEPYDRIRRCELVCMFEFHSRSKEPISVTLVPSHARGCLAGALLLLGPTVLAAAPAKTPGAAKPAVGKPVASASSPEAVIQSFLAAQNAGDDEKAYALLSAASKKKTSLKEWSDRAHQVRSTFSAITLVAGEAMLIGGGGGTQTKVTPNPVKGDKTSVKVTQMLAVPSTRYLVRENGRWVLDIQRSLGVDAEEPKPKPATPPAPTPPLPTTPSTPAAPDFSLQCRTNLRQVGTAFRVYALDHDGKLPDASKWTDEMVGYLQSPTSLKCPPDGPADSNFAFNFALSNVKLSSIDDPNDRVLLYESTTSDKNIAGTGATQPEKSPHPGGWLVLLANGEVAFKTQKPEIK